MFSKQKRSKGSLIAEAIARYKPNKTVDIGYAQAPNPELCRTAHSMYVYGVDIVKIPVPDGYTAVYRVDLNTDRLPFDDARVDAVTMGCTLAHVANPLRVLGEINRILPVGGVLVLSSPNPNYYWETALNVFYHTFKSRVSKAKHVEHFFEFSRYNMRTIADRAGFEVVREMGTTFQFVKTPWRFTPVEYPGIAYEIVYVLEKRREPESFATFESDKGIEKIPTTLFK